MVFLWKLCNSLNVRFLEGKVFLKVLVSVYRKYLFEHNCFSPDCNGNPFSCAFCREKIVVESGKQLLKNKKAGHERSELAKQIASKTKKQALHLFTFSIHLLSFPRNQTIHHNLPGLQLPA